MKANGTITTEALNELAQYVSDLERAVSASDAEVSKDIVDVILRAEQALQGVTMIGATRATASVAVAKTMLGITNGTSSFVQKQAQAKNFPDVAGHWGKSYIDFLVNKGAIAGYPDGTFGPDNTITKAEFLKIAYASAKNGVYTKAPEGTHWATGVFEDAKDIGVLLNYEVKDTDWDKPITRYEMAKIMVRITEKVLYESKTSTAGVGNVMADYSKVLNKSEFKYFVEQAYMKGLISGMDKQGTFGGDKTGTRAEASTMVTRMLAKEYRVKVDTSKVIEAPAGTTVSLTNPSRTLNPQAGMLVTKADGTQVTLKVGPSGVLGENQGVDYYTGITFANGNVFKEGALGTQSMGDYLGSTYLVDDITGEGHFWTDWTKIKDYQGTEARKIQNPQKGQMYGNWYIYDGTEWCWTGVTN